MPEIINYVAVSGDYARFGLAQDPAAQVAAMQAGSPLPIELVAGWIVAPQDRSYVLDQVKRAMRRGKFPRRGEWFEVPRETAINVLELAAAEYGKPWKVRKRASTSEAPDDRLRRAVVTPHGRFNSAAAAAAALGISRQAAWERAARRVEGWRFEDDDLPPPLPVQRGRPVGAKDSGPRKKRTARK